MVKRPSEIFGYPVEDRSNKTRTNREQHWCPFVNLRCNKQSRLINYPMGVCSVEFNGDQISVCPRRFLQDNVVFENIADQYFGTRHNLIVFSEVGLKSIGTFDYVMVKHRPMSSDIEDFVVIEFQTGQTTGTGKLVHALVEFMRGDDIQDRSYAFGMNTYDVWKRSFTQILNKGIVMEAWQKKIYWVVQDQVFQYLVNRYHLNNMTTQSDNATIFLIYDLVHRGSNLTLVQKELRSSSVDALFQAFRNNPSIPTRSQFEAILRSKIKAKLGFVIE